MQEEYYSLQDMKTWKLVNLPENRKPLTCKWVLREKADGRVKARLVSRDFDQKHGIDYNETFAPVARHASIRLLLSYAARKRMNIRTFDVNTAFLNGELSEEIYMLQPQGFDDKSGRVCLLKRSLYGLKQASKDWNRKFTKSIEKLGLIDTDDDPCIFYNKERTVMIGIFLDDGIIIGCNNKNMEQILVRLSEEFKIKHSTPKDAKLYYLGMEIELMEKRISITQQRYTRKILTKFGFECAYPVSTPMEPGMQTEQKMNDKILKDKPYREAIGSLLYLSTISRPDISFAVNYLSRKVSKPNVSDWKMVERVFRYLRGTEHFGIFFDGEARLKSYTDSDYGRTETDMISTSGILIELGGPIVWTAQKQSVTSTSSAEAEYRAIASGIQEVCWIRRIMAELGMQNMIEPTDLFVDNKAAIHMMENAEEGKITKGKKHIEIRRKFINQHINKTVRLVYINTKEQIADMFTKALNKKIVYCIMQIFCLHLKNNYVHCALFGTNKLY